MDQTELEYIFRCPRCQMDTIHYTINRNHYLLGISCSHCRTPSLIKRESLYCQQWQWEQELRQILDNLDHPFDET